MALDHFVYGQKVNNYIEDATSNGTGNDKFESTTLQEWTVPVGKRWLLLYGAVNRAVSSTLNWRILDSAGKVIAHLGALSAATGLSAMISTSDSGSTQGNGGPYILTTGEQVQLNFGTAQDANSYASCVVLEVDM